MKITAVVEDIGRVEVELYAWVCPSCGVLYGLPKAFADRLRENGGHYFCPNGHRLSWKVTEADKLRAALKDAERDREWYKDAEKREREGRQAAERSASAYKGQTTRLRKRAINGVCAFCNRHFANVERHVASKHSTETPDVA